MEPAAYQAWLTGGGGGGSLAARGEQLFSELACNTCHLSDGTRPRAVAGEQVRRAGELANGATVAVDEAYIRESILTPQMKLVAGYQPLMPTFQGLVNEEGVMALDRVREVAARPSAAVARAKQPRTREPTAPAGEQVRPWTTTTGRAAR